MMTSDGQAVGMSHTMDRMQLADPMLKESMIQLLAEKLARNLGGRYAEEKIVPIIAKALHEELG